jgi:hypothetical protein
MAELIAQATVEREAAMQISVQIVVRTEVDEQASVTEIAHFEREGFDAGSLGLHLDVRQRRCWAGCSVR